jgi:hypothetical protein
LEEVSSFSLLGKSDGRSRSVLRAFCSATAISVFWPFGGSKVAIAPGTRRTCPPWTVGDCTAKR